MQAHLDHGDFLGTCTPTCTAPYQQSITAKTSAKMESPLEVNVYPIPTDNTFTLKLSGGSNEQIEISIYDVLGRWVKHIQAAPEKPIVFGDDLPIGSYFAIIGQGENKKTIRLLKN